MSPLEIHCLLEYYAMPDGSPDIHYRHPMAVESLLVNGLIGGDNQDASKPKYALTKRGEAMVEYLINVPLPQEHWIVPPLGNRAAVQGRAGATDRQEQS